MREAAHVGPETRWPTFAAIYPPTPLYVWPIKLGHGPQIIFQKTRFLPLLSVTLALLMRRPQACRRRGRAAPLLSPTSAPMV